MDPHALLNDWLANASLRQSSKDEYRREVESWLTWCATQCHPTVHPYHVGPEHVARWCDETFLRPYLGDVPFTGPEALDVLAAEYPAVAKSHDRRITALIQYYKAAKARKLVLTPPHLYDMRSGLDRKHYTPRRLNPVERAAFIGAVATWGPEDSKQHLRDQLLAYLLLNGLRPAQAVRLDARLMEEQPDLTYQCRLPDDVDGPGRHVTLDQLAGAAVKLYLPHRPTPKPGEFALLLSRTGRPLYSRFPNELVRALADKHPLLAQRPTPVTADIVAHTKLWDEQEKPT
jgi:integrase